MYENILIKILGDKYEEGKSIGEKVLRYVALNRDWDKNPTPTRDASLNAIDMALMDIYGHSLSHYLSNTKERGIVDIRWLAMGVMREMTNYSLTQIGRMFNRNHATILHGINQCKMLVATKNSYAKDYEKLKQKFISYL